MLVAAAMPPPASLQLLNQITAKIAELASDHVVMLGDFNMTPDSGMDRLAAAGPHYSGLGTWAETFGLTDVWRWRHPQSRAYTCHCASHKTFCPIDLFFAGRSVLSRVQDVKILPRGITDHTPILELRLPRHPHRQTLEAL